MGAEQKESISCRQRCLSLFPSVLAGSEVSGGFSRGSGEGVASRPWNTPAAMPAGRAERGEGRGGVSGALDQLPRGGLIIGSFKAGAPCPRRSRGESRM